MKSIIHSFFFENFLGDRYLKSILVPKNLGPFSQRVLLTLEEKNIPYEVTLIDVDNKPEWYESLTALSIDIKENLVPLL